MTFPEGGSQRVDTGFLPDVLPSAGQTVHDYIVHAFEGRWVTAESVARVAPDRVFQYEGEIDWGMLLTPNLVVIKKESTGPFIREISSPVVVTNRTLRPVDDDAHRSVVAWGAVVTQVPDDIAGQLMLEASELRFRMIATAAYPRTR